MHDKKRKSEATDPWANWEQDTYQTGSTQPPKSNGGVIASLLVLIIFLCGLSTALGLMNIRLFRKLNAVSSESVESPVAFSQAVENTKSDTCYPLGFSAQDIPELWSVYQDLPQGVYITEVKEDSDAAAKGVSPGDILISVDGITVTSTTKLNEIINTRQPLATTQVVIFRDGKHMPMTLHLQN